MNYLDILTLAMPERGRARQGRDGRPVVILVDPEHEHFYQVDTPRLGEAEPALVDSMLRVLGGR